MSAPPRILLVDFSALFWTLWHATAGESSNEAYERSLRVVEHSAAEHDHTAICCDSPRSWRREVFPDYKAQRPPKPHGAVELLKRTVAKLKERGHHILVADGFEGDDVIATACAWALDALPGCQVTIKGADKDLFALLSDQVSIEKIDGETFGLADLKQRADITPADVPLYLALIGDKADNIPGVTKCGPKTASWLIAEFGTVDKLFHAVRETPTVFGGKKALVANLMECGEAGVREAMRLTTLRRDVPIDCTVILEPIKPRVKFGGGPPPEDGSEMPTEDGPPPENEDHMDSDVPDAEYTSDPGGEAPAATAPEPAPAPPEQPAPMPAKPPPAPKPDPRNATAGQAEMMARAEQQRAPSTALARTTEWSLQLEPTGLRSAWWMAEKVVSSGLFRKKFTEPAQAFTAIMAGRERGMGVFQAMLNVDIVEGAPRFTSRSIIGMVRASPHCEYIEPVLDACDETKAVWRAKRLGRPEQTHTYTIHDAKLAGLVRERSNWERVPKPMLRKQAGVELAREMFPEVIAGVYSIEEMVDREYTVNAEPEDVA